MKNPIILLAQGRCGSTLLQRILNTSPEITMWGEHEGFLKPLANSYFILTQGQEIEQYFYSQNDLNPSIVIGELKDYKKKIAWINSFNPQIVQDKYKQLIIEILNNNLLNIENIYWGFKEIRYTKDDQFFDMWLELFPDTRFIFSLRNPFDTISSMMKTWGKVDKNTTENRMQNLIKNYAQRWNNLISSVKYWTTEKQCFFYIQKYEDLVENPEKNIVNMFSFLEIQIPENYAQVMAYKTEGRKNMEIDNKIKQSIYESKNIIWDILGESAQYFGYNIDYVNSFYTSTN